jgi:kynurenine formamidase
MSAATVLIMPFVAFSQEAKPSWTPPAEAERCPSKWGAEDERGSSNHMSAKSVLKAVGLMKTGETIELGHMLNGEMPFGGGRAWNMISKRTNINPGSNERGSNEELLVTELGQIGTDLDGFGHQTHRDKFYNCFTSEDITTRTGLKKLGVEKIGTLITRGILLDIAGTKGVETLPNGYEVTVTDLEEALKRAALTIEPGDAVLLRYGWSKFWGTDNAAYRDNAPGIGVEAGLWLAAKDPMLVGADNSTVEMSTNTDKQLSLPVHQIFLVVNGILNLESVKLDEIAEKGFTEFAFIMQPIRMEGASGSAVFPVAIR